MTDEQRFFFDLRGRILLPGSPLPAEIEVIRRVFEHLLGATGAQEHTTR